MNILPLYSCETDEKDSSARLFCCKSNKEKEAQCNNIHRCIMIFAILLLIGTTLGMAGSLLQVAPKNNGFELICEMKSIAGDIPITKYISRNTGLQVVIARVQGPIVHGYFTVATEAQDDDGLPHTLEHVVFLGSEDYPYKGVLDLLANRCLARGTNAWTDVAHTAYTVETAGTDGFLNLLSIYLDHLLYPTITDSGFTTEVYHITGEGEDAGVVYSEMQARENTGESLTYNALMRSLYPSPSGYRYETGGILANLRDSISNEKIKEFHKVMYRPENLHVIIAGQIDPLDVFQALRPIEDKILSKGDRGPFTRPWQTPVPPFVIPEDIELVYPSDTEDTGIVRIGWRGPALVTDINEYHSMEVLMEYLTDLSISPLPKIFVETNDPYASEITEYMLENSASSCVLTFKGVPKDKIDLIKPVLVDTLNKIVNETIPFDLFLMENILKNLILKEQSKLETNPHDSLAMYLIADLLYGNSCEDLEKYVNKIRWLEELLGKPTSYWLQMLQKYLILAPFSYAIGIPSIAEANRSQEIEARRIQERIGKLGDAGLKEWGEKVEKAAQINDIPPPQEMLQSVPVPTVTNIHFHSLTAYSNIRNVLPISLPQPSPAVINMKKIPVKMQLDDIKSNFVEIIAILDTSSLSSSQKMYLQLLLDLILESPIQRGGVIVPYEEVVKNLNADTIKAETINGLSLWESFFTFEQYFTYVGIDLKVEMPKYEKGVEWLKDILFNVVFDAERVRVKTSKLINSIGEKKRNGHQMLHLMHNDVIFRPDTNINKVNVLRQEKFLTKLLSDMKADPTEVLQQLEIVYDTITSIDNMVIHLASNFDKLETVTELTTPWVTFTPSGKKTKDFSFYPISDSAFTKHYDPADPTTGYITGLGSVESAFLLQTAKSLDNYSDAELPALMTAISYLTQLEGPMWKEIRGKGLAYHYGIVLKPNEGTLTLKLTQAAQLIGAYREAISILKQHLNGVNTWDPLLFESARSSLLYTVISRESEVSDVVQQSLLAYYRQVPHDYNRALLNKISEVTMEEMAVVANKYFRPLIDPKQSKTVIVCQPPKVTEVKTELNRMGHNLDIIPSLETSQFSQL